MEHAVSVWGIVRGGADRVAGVAGVGQGAGLLLMTQQMQAVSVWEGWRREGGGGQGLEGRETGRCWPLQPRSPQPISPSFLMSLNLFSLHLLLPLAGLLLAT